MSFNPRESDLAATEAELAEARKEAHNAKKEVARLRGERAALEDAAKAAGGDLSTALEIIPSAVEERGELEVLRHEIDLDVEALNELRHPSGALLNPEPIESARDIVRANQRERAELQERSATANTLLSRIAALVKLDRWDEDGGDKLLTRLQALSTMQLKLNQRIRALKQQLALIPDLQDPPESDVITRAAITQTITALEAALAMPVERPVDDPTKPRHIRFTVLGRDVMYTALPDDKVSDSRDVIIRTVYGGADPGLPLEQWLIFDENGRPLNVSKTWRETSLPSLKVVITTPAGYGG